MKFFSPQDIQWGKNNELNKDETPLNRLFILRGKMTVVSSTLPHIESQIQQSVNPAGQHKTHSHQFNHPPSTDSKLIIPAFNYSIRLPLRSLKDGWISGFGVLAGRVGRPLHCDSGG